MRILLVTGSFPPMRCGVGDYSYNLAKSLVAGPKVNVGVLTSALGGETDKADGIEVFPVLEKWSIFAALKVIKVISDWSPDIVHIQYPSRGYGNGFLPWVLPIISFLMRKKIVQTWHGGYGRRDVLKFYIKLIVPTKLVVVHANYKNNFHPMLRRALLRRNPVFIPNASAIPHVDLSEHEKDLIKKRYISKQKRLVVFFGFVYPHKGVELLFDIADPSLDQLIIAGEFDVNGQYKRVISNHASAKAWQGKVTITGFLPAKEVAELLAVADAVILPFRSGGGEWNTSIHGAVLNGTFIVTTSQTQSGYDNKRNIYFAKVDSIQEMKMALTSYAGMRRKYDPDIDRDEWQQIANQHYLLYESLLSE